MGNEALHIGDLIHEDWDEDEEDDSSEDYDTIMSSMDRIDLIRERHQLMQWRKEHGGTSNPLFDA